MKRYNISFVIEEIGYEGEVEDIVDTKCYYVKETLFNRMLAKFKSEIWELKK